jgi:hypothetical protein
MPCRVSGLPNVRRRKRPPQLRHNLAAKLNWTSTGESAAAANGAAKQTHDATVVRRVWHGAASVWSSTKRGIRLVVNQSPPKCYVWFTFDWYMLPLPLHLHLLETATDSLMPRRSTGLPASCNLNAGVKWAVVAPPFFNTHIHSTFNNHQLNKYSS